MVPQWLSLSLPNVPNVQRGSLTVCEGSLPILASVGGWCFGSSQTISNPQTNHNKRIEVCRGANFRD